MSEVRLIDANAAIVLITQKYNIDRVADENVAFAMIDLVSDIAELPTITPESLGWRKEVHGRWYPNMEVVCGEVKHEQECSVCKQRIKGTDKPPYCSNCGARMDGEE